MSNIDKQALPLRMRNYLETALKSGVKLLHLSIDELEGLLDELEAAEKRIAKMDVREEALRVVGVMSEAAFHRLEARQARFVALWPRPEIYSPRKRPEDGVIVYARTATANSIKGSE